MINTAIYDCDTALEWFVDELIQGFFRWYRVEGYKRDMDLDASYIHFAEILQLRMEQAYGYYFHEERKESK